MKKLILSILVITMAYVSNAQLQEGSFEFDDYLRKYWVFLPKNYADTINFPLVINLHCYGSTAQGDKDYTLLHQVADTSDFIVVFPNAIPNWNSGVGENPDFPTPDVNDVGFIDALIDTLKNKYSIDLERIYTCGFSNGGFMSYKLACQLSHRIAAIASVGGVMSTNTKANCNPLHNISILQIHGTGDPVVPINGTTGWTSSDQTLTYWIEFNNCIQADTILLPDIDKNDDCNIEKIIYTNCNNNSNVVYYKVINGGHTWPGSSSGGFGNTNHDVNASVEIWNFFKNYKNPLADVAYSKSLEVYPSYIQALSDTLTVRITLNNPENHPVNVNAIIQGVQSTFKDTIQLFDDGLHGDNFSSDNIWGNRKLLLGLSEDIYIVDLVVHDLNFGTEICYSSQVRFTTIGPVTIENYTFIRDDTIPNPGDKIYFEITLRNNDPVTTATNIKTNISVSDANVSFNQFGNHSYGDISPGQTASTTGYCRIEIESDYPYDKEISVYVDITSDGHTYWKDTLYILVQPVNIKEIREPITRIYPNPTNEILNIEIGNSVSQRLEIEILDITGKVVYQGKYKNTNLHFVEKIDLSGYAKGIYLVKVRQSNSVYMGKLVVR